MDEHYLLTTARYVELNPVRAKLADRPEAYKWSSAITHLEGRDDEPVKASPLLGFVGNWGEFLSQMAVQHQMEALRLHEGTGRPLGGEGFVAKLEKALGRILHRQKPGHKRRTQN